MEIYQLVYYKVKKQFFLCLIRRAEEKKATAKTGHKIKLKNLKTGMKTVFPVENTGKVDICVEFDIIKFV